MKYQNINNATCGFHHIENLSPFTDKAIINTLQVLQVCLVVHSTYL